MYKRALLLPEKPKKSFFLWGPRQAGKTTLLKKVYPKAHRIDLLKTNVLMPFLLNPQIFREEIFALPVETIVVIDEIQKAPQLLDEIHYLIQEQNRIFVLCGSSARKVKRGHANLLGGRALRYELFGLCCNEMGEDFDLERIVNNGYTPDHYKEEHPFRSLQGYV
jgi:predicted AAA+ superfamily ATPase